MSRVESAFWKGRRVLVTGHTGFKGSWLALWLESMGASVVGYALDPLTERDNFVLAGLEGRVDHQIGDIRDQERLFACFQQLRPEIVFHLAAQPLVRESYVSPKETYDVNIGGTVNLLECCRLTDSVRVVVNVTTDKCYDNKEWVWPYREGDRLGGFDPYSSSKACSELVTAGYRSSFFNPEFFDRHGKAVATARAGNVFGGGDWQVDRIVPDCVRHLERNEPIIVRSPHAVRPWQHVLEPLSGYLLLAQRMAEDPVQFAEAWNFGPRESSFLPVGALVDKMVNGWGSGSWEDRSSPDAPHEANLLKLDINKASSVLGWEPVWDMGTAVAMTIEWYRNYRDRSVHELCARQISAYMQASNEAGG